MILGREAKASEHAIWVGVLNLDRDDAVTGVNGPLLPAHRQARVLIRQHLAPIGYVQVPAVPSQSLTSRVRAQAEASLAGALSRHAQLDLADAQSRSGAGWAERTICPLRFPAPDRAGVTVVVCTRDRSDELQSCLTAMQHFSYQPLEILVVDNAPSSDATQKVVNALADTDQRIRYTLEPRPGLSLARNHGLERARYDIVAFTDDDTLADPGWPDALTAAFAADPEVVCVTGLVATSSLETSSERYFDARYSSRTTFEPRRYDMGDRPTRLYPYNAGIFGKGANFALRRAAIARIGGFDPVLGAGGPGRGGEDLDMFLRVILSGGRICYMPSALVWHRHRTDVGALGEQLYAYGHGLGAYTAKYLSRRDLQAALLSNGVRQAYGLVSQMRGASRLSQLGPGGKRLAFAEVRGVAAGALRYWAGPRGTSHWPLEPL
jgi:GT2 family glycosyltransferase